MKSLQKYFTSLGPKYSIKKNLWGNVNLRLSSNFFPVICLIWHRMTHSIQHMKWCFKNLCIFAITRASDWTIRHSRLNLNNGVLISTANYFSFYGEPDFIHPRSVTLHSSKSCFWVLVRNALSLRKVLKTLIARAMLSYKLIFLLKLIKEPFLKSKCRFKIALLLST